MVVSVQFTTFTMLMCPSGQWSVITKPCSRIVSFTVVIDDCAIIVGHVALLSVIHASSTMTCVTILPP